MSASPLAQDAQSLNVRYRRPYTARQTSVSWNLMVGKIRSGRPNNTDTVSRPCFARMRLGWQDYSARDGPHPFGAVLRAFNQQITRSAWPRYAGSKPAIATGIINKLLTLLTEIFPSSPFDSPSLPPNLPPAIY